MTDHYHEELNRLRGLVVKLANEIDYKNHLLMEKDGLSLEKFATMSSLMEEKDRLLGERSAVIGSLMVQKHRLHEVLVEERRKCEQVKQEMKNVRLELEVQQQKPDTRTNNWIVPANQSSEFFNKHDKLQNRLEKLQHLKARNEDLKENSRKELNEKEGSHQLGGLNQTLASDECSSNEELEAARMEAIKWFLAMDGNGTEVGIKRVGDIDQQPFRDVCSKVFSNRSWEKEFHDLYTLWQENVNNPSWNPFTKEINSGKLSEVIDENDKKLSELRKQWGEEAYKAVVNALLDSRKYNSRMRSSIHELWNYAEGRKAYLKEVIQYIFQRCDRNKDNEQSGAINELIAEKEKLLEKLASCNIILEEKDKLLKEKYAEVAKLMAQDMEKDKLLSKSSATISTLMAEKHLLLKICNAERGKTKCMKEQIEKRKHVSQCQEDLTKQTEEHKEAKCHSYGGKGSVVIKEEVTDWFVDPLTDQEGPTAKKLKYSKVHNTVEEISSTSNNIKLLGQNSVQMSKLPQVELDMLEEPSNGRLDDVLRVSRPSTHSHLLLSNAVISSLSHPMAPETMFPKADVKKEDEEYGEKGLQLVCNEQLFKGHDS